MHYKYKIAELLYYCNGLAWRLLPRIRLELGTAEHSTHRSNKQSMYLGDEALVR